MFNKFVPKGNSLQICFLFNFLVPIISDKTAKIPPFDTLWRIPQLLLYRYCSSSKFIEIGWELLEFLCLRTGARTDKQYFFSFSGIYELNSTQLTFEMLHCCEKGLRPCISYWSNHFSLQTFRNQSRFKSAFGLLLVYKIIDSYDDFSSTEVMDLLCMTTGMLDTPCRFWLGPVLALMLGKPEDLQTVLLSPKCLDKPYVYRFMDVNLGLLTAPCEWKSNLKFFWIKCNIDFIV